VGLLGQLTITTAGVSSASTSSMVMVPAAVICPEASSVTWDIGDLDSV
jgi:hypothetical protein